MKTKTKTKNQTECNIGLVDSGIVFILEFLVEYIYQSTLDPKETIAAMGTFAPPPRNQSPTDHIGYLEEFSVEKSCALLCFSSQKTFCVTYVITGNAIHL